MATEGNIQRFSLQLALKEKSNVMGAVILRDMRTRFFDHGLGFLVQSIWPLCHMLVIIGISYATGRAATYGDSLPVFIGTGLVPTLTFIYVSRFMSLSLILNRPMLAFPVVGVLDILAARAFLELTASAITVTLMFCVISVIGDNPFPADVQQATVAYAATILLAVGVGTLVGVVVMFINAFLTAYALFGIVVYLTSGTLFNASALPEAAATYLSWNPVFQCVEWMRSAYFETYDTKLLDKGYVVTFGLVSLCLGLMLERLFRRKMLEG